MQLRRKVKADTTEAVKRVEVLRGVLTKVGGRTVTVAVRVPSTNASRALAALRGFIALDPATLGHADRQKQRIFRRALWDIDALDQ